MSFFIFVGPWRPIRDSEPYLSGARHFSLHSRTSQRLGICQKLRPRARHLLEAANSIRKLLDLGIGDYFG